MASAAIGDSHTRTKATTRATSRATIAAQATVAVRPSGDRNSPVIMVLRALAWTVTPGWPDDLSSGVSLESPIPSAVAPTRTIFPLRASGGSVPPVTSAAE
jgi:hypothetical protein